MEVKIKSLERKDFNRVIDFAIQGMHFERYVSNQLGIRLYGRYFLYLELERATHVLAAYSGQKLVGVIMADMKNEKKLYISFWRSFYVKIFKAILGIAVRGGQDVYDEANKEMFESFERRVAIDGELCLLATDPTVQGKGVGTKLLEALSKGQKGKSIYLYTDNYCTYQFYEHKGFECFERKEITMEFGKQTVPLTCLLYSRQL